MRGKRERIWKVELTDKELNYIEGALRERIKEYATGPFSGLGNVPHLLWFCKKTYRKLRLLRGWPRNVRLNYLPLRFRRKKIARRS